MNDWMSVVSHLVPVIVALCFIVFSVVGTLGRRANEARQRDHERHRQSMDEVERLEVQLSVPRAPAAPRPPAPPKPPRKVTPRYAVVAVPLEGEGPTVPNGTFSNKREAEVFARRLAKAEPTSEVVVVRVKTEEYVLVIPPREVPHLVTENDQVRDEEEI